MGIEAMNNLPEKGPVDYAKDIKKALQERYQKLYPAAHDISTEEVEALVKDHLLGNTDEEENQSLEKYIEISWHGETMSDVLKDLATDIAEDGVFDDILEKFHTERSS